MKRRFTVLALASAGVALGVPAACADAAGFGIHTFEAGIEAQGGGVAIQAGSHPEALQIGFELNSETNGKGILVPSGGDVKQLEIRLPAGMAGKATGIPRCPRELLDAEVAECPPNTQVGVTRVGLSAGPSVTVFTLPVYNLVPPANTPVELGFSFNGINGLIDTTLGSTSEGYRVTEIVHNVTQRDIITDQTAIWGVPGETAHNAEREPCLGAHGNIPPEQCPPEQGRTPFLVLPAQCGTPLEFELHATLWQDPSATASAKAEAPALSGCEALTFGPSLTAALDSSSADTPTGLSAEVTALTAGLETPDGHAAADIRNAVVTLPTGVALNPGRAATLAACPAALQELEHPDLAPQCPPSSVIGTDEIETPLLPGKLAGQVYLLPGNPPHLQLLVAASGEGINLKLPAAVSADSVTGQLTTSFLNAPPLPFSHFRLRINGGSAAGLTTPLKCGSYTADADFAPWSSPLTADVLAGALFTVDLGTGGLACPAAAPFSSSVVAGATSSEATSFTNFSLSLTRPDGQQRISSIQVKTPPGLLGMITNVPRCEEPSASLGTCPASTKIGHNIVEAGPGPSPLVVPQPGQPEAPVYLTGPYRGGPYGLSIVTPVVAGPFNLGNVVVRARIDVDSHTGQLTVSTDQAGPYAIPQIIAGVPVDLRADYILIDRPSFLFNPSGCRPAAVSLTAASVEGDVSFSSSPFHLGSCSSLKFAPHLTASTSAHTSRLNGASLYTKVVFPRDSANRKAAADQSNVASVKVELPKILPSRLTTLQQACRDTIFEVNPELCPKASRVGIARAFSPVLPNPLGGTVFFVSHGGAKFPDLVVVLESEGVRIDLVANTFISKAGITSSTFKALPDAPVSSFELYLPQGPHSAVAGFGNLCNAKLVMPTTFTAQNGAVTHEQTKISVTNCPHARKSRSARGSRGATRAKRHTSATPDGRRRGK
jgi:hypothetical protein